MHTDWNCPPWPGTIVTICMRCFMTGDPDKEYGTNKPPPTGRVWERSKGDTTCPTTSQNPSRWHPSWLNKGVHHQEGLWVRMIGQRTQKLIPSPQNPRLRATWESSSPGFPYPTPLHLGALSRKISCFVSTCVSSNNSFLSVRQEPSLGPGRGPPTCNSTTFR